jgi:chemotaxis protein MotB
MARRKPPPSHENHERWLVSYADFMTLLFAFFVVMFASSQTDKSRARQVSQSVEKALKEGKSVAIRPAVALILGGTVDDKGRGNAQMKGSGGANKEVKPPVDPPVKVVEVAPKQVLELAPSMKNLTTELAKEIKDGKLEVKFETRGLVVSMKQAAFFPSGNDTISPETYSVIEKVAAALKAVSNPLRIEGHTDSIPIHTARFRSNWELSAARGISMMELLADRFGVSRQRVAIVGYADTAPQTSNDTPEGRAMNRRVDIVILNQFALANAGAEATAAAPKK